MKRLTMSIVAGLAFWLGGTSARADYVIEIIPSGTTEVLQGGTTSFTVTAANTGTTAIELGQLTLGIQLLADGSPTGSMAIGTFALAATNSPWSNPGITSPTLLVLGNGNVNGTSAYYLMSITENDLDNVGDIPVGESRNLGLITLTTSNDALGMWRLFIVNERDEFGTPLTAITTPLFETVDFANLVAPAYPTIGVSFTAATFIAVPEPGAAVLAAVGGLLAALVAARHGVRADGCRTAWGTPRPQPHPHS